MKQMHKNNFNGHDFGFIKYCLLLLNFILCHLVLKNDFGHELMAYAQMNAKMNAIWMPCSNECHLDAMLK